MYTSLDSELNKLRSQAVLSLIRKRFQDDCTDDNDASGGHMAYMHLVSLFFIALEARGFDDRHYEQCRDAAMKVLDLDENDLRAARRETLEMLALPITGQGMHLTLSGDVAPF